MRRNFIILLFIVGLTSLMSQPTIDALNENNNSILMNDSDIEMNDSFISVNHEKEDAHLIALMSAIIPGSGSIYLKPNRWLGYVYPILEGFLIYKYLDEYKKGDDKTAAYEKYVNGENIVLKDDSGHVVYRGPRYNREIQYAIENLVCNVNTVDIYTTFQNEEDKQGAFFRLDRDNTQHFYEDVAKYNKYVYGWSDWIKEYAYTSEYGNDEINLDMYQNELVQNYVLSNINWSSTSTDPESLITGYGPDGDKPYSSFRQKYITMRHNAQDCYDNANLYLFGIIMNHALSVADAIFVVKDYNKQMYTQNSFKVNYSSTIYNENFTPMVYLTKEF